MIEGFCTDFNNVCTVLKGAKIVCDFLEKHDAVITFDGTIFFKAKEIQLNFSKELSNTVLEDYTPHSTSCLCWVIGFVLMHQL